MSYGDPPKDQQVDKQYLTDTVSGWAIETVGTNQLVFSGTSTIDIEILNIKNKLLLIEDKFNCLFEWLGIEIDP